MYISHGLDVTSARSFSYICQPGARVGFDGPMAEWLGSALQKLLQRFESASDLQPSRSPKQPLGVFLCAVRKRKLACGSSYKAQKRRGERSELSASWGCEQPHDLGRRLGLNIASPLRIRRPKSASDLQPSISPKQLIGVFVPIKIPSTPAINRCDIIMTCRLYRRSNFVP